MVAIEGDSVELPLTMNTTVEELLAHPKGGPLLQDAIGDKFDAHFLRLIGPNPVGRFDGLPLPLAQMEALIAEASA